MNELVSELNALLKGPLPGLTAQREMSARLASGDRFDFRHQGAVKKGAVTILLYPQQGLWHLPLMKRPDYQGIHSGQISLPGGKAEPQDQDRIQTALRETAEEIGVSIKREQVVGTLTPLYIMASHYEVLPVVAIMDQKPSFVPDPREVQALIQADLKQLMSPHTRQKKEIEVRGTAIMAPYFDVQQEVVWGATAMILNEFLAVINRVSSL